MWLQHSGGLFLASRKETTHESTHHLLPPKKPAPPSPPILDVVGPMKLTDTQIIDMVEATIGTRKAVLSPREFAQITGMNPNVVRRECGQTIPATRSDVGRGGHWRIPATALRPYLEGDFAA